MENSRIALVIPAYNEELTIAKTLEGFAQHLPGATIVVVDNNSSDKTVAIALAKIKELGCDGNVISEKRQGKGMAVKKAFNEIEADYYVMVDADTTYDPADVHKLLKPVMDAEQDMVVGDRHSSGMYKLENKRQFHNFGNALVTKIINMLFKSKLVDILSGYRVFSRRFIKSFPITCAGFEIETEMTLHALDKHFSLKEIPVNYKDRPEGSFSKINTFSDGIRILRTIMWVFKDYRPLIFFGSLSVLFALLGILMGLPVLYEYVQYKYIYRVPSAILSTGLMIFSLLFLGIGLILDTVAKFQRFNYELYLLGGTGRKSR